MDSETLINSFEMKKKDRAPNYLWKKYLFVSVLITFRHYYYAKYICLTWLIIFHFFITSQRGGCQNGLMFERQICRLADIH